MRKMTLQQLAFGAILAAVYAVLTVTLPIPQYGAVQFRLAEALCMLPFFFPAATPGLVIGCVIANLFSPFALWDVPFGSAATLLACLWTGRLRNRWLSPMPAVVCNAIIVGAEIALAEVGFSPAFWPTFGFHALTVGVGELAVCCVLGQLVLSAVYRTPTLRERIDPVRLGNVRGFKI